jgi:hypothetical protein
MRAKATQQLLPENGIDFWGNEVWPCNSPDLNAAEHIGSIIRDEIEVKMFAETGPQRFSLDTLTYHVKDFLISLENRVDLFQDLLCCYTNRIKR